MRTKIGETDRYKALLMNKQGFSLRQIAASINRSHSCVDTILKRYKETGSIEDRFRSGRPTISNAEENRQLVRIMKKNRQKSSMELAKLWDIKENVTASPRTVRRVLQNEGYPRRSAHKKQYS